MVGDSIFNVDLRDTRRHSCEFDLGGVELVLARVNLVKQRIGVETDNRVKDEG